jgi:hypothetical protein
MIKAKYKLIEVTTGNAVTYGDDNTVIFGGPWGACDEQGNPLYVWTDNIPDEVEVIAESNALIKTQIEEIELKSARALREILLYTGKNNSESQEILVMAQSKIVDYESQIIALRSQLK